MAANYPLTQISFTQKVDLRDIVLASDINSVYDEVTAIGVTLGTLPAENTGWQGGSFDQSTTSWNTVRERIQNIEYGLYTAFNDRVNKTGGTTITPLTNTVVNLTVQSKVGQTADIFQGKTSSGNTVTKIDKDGILYHNSAIVATRTNSETLTNKTINGPDNLLTNIAPGSVIVSGSTNIKQYVDARPVNYYQSTQPDAVALSTPLGSIWVDSSTDITPFDSTAYLLKGTADNTFLAITTAVANYATKFELTTNYYNKTYIDQSVYTKSEIDQNQVSKTYGDGRYLQTAAASVGTTSSDNGYRRIRVSTSAPTSGDGANGDIWIQYI
jgi:hypothetical protein